MTWEVWDVRPASPVLMTATQGSAPQALAHGWLCFQSGSTRKRLFPIPEGWEQLPVDELIRLWRTATPAPTRGPGAAGNAPPPEARSPARSALDQSAFESSRDPSGMHAKAPEPPVGG
jgi:hypothetical protein